MEARERPRMHKYGESKTTRIMMTTVRHVAYGSGLRKLHAAWFFLDRMYKRNFLSSSRRYYRICDRQWFRHWNNKHSIYLEWFAKNHISWVYQYHRWLSRL